MRAFPHSRAAALSAAIVLLLTIAVPARATDRGWETAVRAAGGVSESDIIEASQKPELSLFDVYALSVRRTETLAVRGEQALQADARRDQAIGMFLPRVSLRGTRVFPQEDSKFASSAQRSSLSLYARQPIITGLGEYSQYRSAGYEMKLAGCRLYEDAASLLLEVASNYYRVIQLERSIGSKEQILTHYGDIARELQRRVAVGRSRMSDLERTLAQRYTLEAELKTLKSDLSSARLALSSRAGIHEAARLRDRERVDAPPGPDGDAAALAARWDVKAARAQCEIADAKLLAARGGHLPSVYLEGYYRLYQSGPDTGTRDYYGALGVELPLFSGGVVSAQVREAESKRREADLMLSRVSREAAVGIADARRGFDDSGAEMEAYRNALDSAERNYALTMQDYYLNLVTILDVLTSLTQLQSARDAHQRSVLLLRYDRVRLGVALGELPGAGIRILKP